MIIPSLNPPVAPQRAGATLPDRDAVRRETASLTLQTFVVDSPDTSRVAAASVNTDALQREIRQQQNALQLQMLDAIRSERDLAAEEQNNLPAESVATAVTPPPSRVKDTRRANGSRLEPFMVYPLPLQAYAAQPSSAEPVEPDYTPVTAVAATPDSLQDLPPRPAPERPSASRAEVEDFADALPIPDAGLPLDVRA